jgi:hypothetical protein
LGADKNYDRLVRVATVTLLIALVLAPAAWAQDSVSRAAADLPPSLFVPPPPATLFEPPPDGVPAGVGPTDEGGGVSLLVAGILLAAAAAAGYLAGSSRRTRRS